MTAVSVALHARLLAQYGMTSAAAATTGVQSLGAAVHAYTQKESRGVPDSPLMHPHASNLCSRLHVLRSLCYCF
jgi:hypothetical protein